LNVVSNYMRVVFIFELYMKDTRIKNKFSVYMVTDYNEDMNSELDC